MRKQVKNYRAYFNAKDRRLKVSTQNKVPETPAQLHMAVMAAICGLKDAQPNMILRSVFQAGLDLNHNTVYQDFVNIMQTKHFGRWFVRDADLWRKSQTLGGWQSICF